MTTTTNNGPPNDDEKGGNVVKLWAHATVFFAIMCAFISVVMAVLSSFRPHHGLYALRTADFELVTH